MLLHLATAQECLWSDCREFSQPPTCPESRAEYLNRNESWLRLAGNRRCSERLKLFVADREHRVA